MVVVLRFKVSNNLIIKISMKHYKLNCITLYRAYYYDLKIRIFDIFYIGKTYEEKNKNTRRYYKSP